MVSVLVVDDHPVVREGVSAILRSEPGVDVVGQCHSGEQALRQAIALHPDVVVLDLRLPGASGLEVCAALAQREPKTKVVMLTSFPNEGVIQRAFTAGAKAFVVKESDPGELRKAVTTVMAGETFVDPRTAKKLIALATKGRRAKGPFGLTLQEMRVLERVPKGLTNREIGEELGVSEETIKTHLAHAMRKLRVHDRAAAAAIAIREGLG
jgi:DNA-binding NarL/FixJ family response regulator